MALFRERNGARPAATQDRGSMPRILAAVTVWGLPIISALACGTQVAWGAPSPFYMGADISLETYMQQQNVQFADNRGQAPLDTIMYDHGANLFRLRIFVNPATVYDSNNVGAIQTTAYDIALAQQIKAHAPNAKIVLDFHYSDTWADPGHQSLPAAWATPTQTLTQLEATVQAYTQTTLQTFKDAGVMPDIVQLGNETTSGTMFPTGRLNFNGTTAQKNASWAAYGGLWNAAIRGVRAMEAPPHPGDPPLPRIPVSLSIDRGDKAGQPQFHYGLVQQSATVPDSNGLTGGGVTDFDIEGVDYYPTSTNLATTMNANLIALANTNNDSFTSSGNTLPLKKIMLLETNSPWENSSVGDANQFPKTAAGQLLELHAVRDLIYNLPHDDGEGVVWWYPEAVTPFTNYNSGATALFDSTGNSNVHNALPALTDGITVAGITYPNPFGSTLIPGDVDHDGAVTMNDYTVLRDNFGMGPNARSFNGDLNRDGMVDLSDFKLWRDIFLASGGAGAGAAGVRVPEPASAVLILIAMPLLCSLGALRLRRNRR
jgi:arabinogalactan endo-1,4-beta-galactosidase